ncbi:MAG: arginine--tRNA ligase [Clostridia bacterium]|nr:arginine--tRNA ligase [Clostridia bacterium]
MERITQILTDKVSAAFQKCGYDAELGTVSVSDRPELCQFQCNGSFKASKLAKKAPLAVAEEVCSVLSEDSAVKIAEAVKPGFINITLDDSYLIELLAGLEADEHLGVPQIGKGEKIIIDYGGPNVAKPLHIGHLRSAIIGESLKRLARACGSEVYGDIHMGDWGLQIGLVIAELAVRNPDWRCFADDFDTESETVDALDVDLLNEVYPFASKKSKEDEAFAKAAHEATFELQNGRAGYIALWKEIMRASVADLKSNYEKLNVDFELWYGESDADKYIPELIERLTEKNLLRESDGAMVVDVAREDDKAPMPPVIVKKSDNSSIYATTDLATIIQRERDFAPDKIWYVVDKRQGLHFEQVFRCAKLAGLVPEKTELEFLGFGTMNGSDGKPYKTRDGGVMRLSDLLKTVTDGAAEKLSASEFVTDENRAETAKRVGMAAVKFGDLINHRAKDYIFDLDKFLSFEGKTGTYLLYTVTRINSILKKTADEKTVLSGIHNDAERELILSILLSGEAFCYAHAEKAPNYICDSAYRIAGAFSRFYHDSHILTEQDEATKSSWLALIKLTKAVLSKHLDVLGIEAVDAM